MDRTAAGAPATMVGSVETASGGGAESCLGGRLDPRRLDPALARAGPTLRALVCGRAINERLQTRVLRQLDAWWMDKPGLRLGNPAHWRWRQAPQPTAWGLPDDGCHPELSSAIEAMVVVPVKPS